MLKKGIARNKKGINLSTKTKDLIIVQLREIRHLSGLPNVGKKIVQSENRTRDFRMSTVSKRS